jgi:ABC-2 type transport system permease protein
MIDLSRTFAMLIKEFVQLRRDRLTFSTMIFIPVVQLLLFGYAINTTPRHLPTAVLVHEENDLTRSVLAALGNTSYFSVTRVASSEAEMDHWMRSGDVLFGVEIPAGRRWRPWKALCRPRWCATAASPRPSSRSPPLRSVSTAVTTLLR